VSFLFKRALHYWQMLLTLALGVILATGMLASGPLLIDTVMNFALPYKLRDSDPLASNLRITTYTKLELSEYQTLDDQLRSILNQRLGKHLAQVNGLASSGWAYPWLNGQLIPDQRIAPSFYENLSDKVTFIAGGWPSGSALQNNVLQVVVSEVFAEAYGLQVGDQLALSKQLSEPGPTFWLSIGGIVRPTDPRDVYWFGKYNPLQNLAEDRWSAQFFVFIPKEQFFTISEQLFPSVSPRLDWNVIINPTSYHVGDIPAARSQIDLLRADLKELPNTFNLETKLDQVLKRFSAQAQIVRITLYVLVVEVLFLALYYVTMVASLSTQQVEGEFSTLSSRGSSFGQLFQIQSTEALLISILALIIGPALAILMVWYLAKFGPLADIAAADWTLSLPSAGWITAGVSVVVCSLGMILPLRSAVKRSIVAYSRSTSRTDRPQWWQRIYLDVFVLITALILLWRLRFYGSLASSAGIGRVDWLLVLSPLVLLLGSATILLRIFPPILRIFARLAARGRGISTTLALWQTSRNPAHVARLVLLLTLTMAMGILATGINATLDGSEYERAFYATGSDLRLVFNGPLPIHEINEISGVSATSMVWRGTGSSSVRYHDSIPTFNILAIEPFSFSHVSLYRTDYADQPMGELLGQIISDPNVGGNTLIPLPGKPARLGLWIYDSTWRNPGQPSDVQPLDNLMVTAKLQTADNQVFVVRLTRMTGSGTATGESQWSNFEAVLPELSPGSYPLSFHSFWFTISRTGRYLERINLVLDDFSVIDADSGESYIFEGFEEINRIWQTNSQNSPANYTRSFPAHSGEASLLFSLPDQVNASGYALIPVSTIRSDIIPALVSQEFLNITAAKVGDTILLNIQSIQMPIEIMGTVNYFPTLYENTGRGYLIVSRDALMYRLNREQRIAINPNEIWIGTKNEQVSTQLQTSYPYAGQTWDVDSERRSLKADALTLGLRSVTFLAYILTATLSLVGFATHFYMNARQREMQFGILRSLGLSPGQLYGWLLLEQIIMILAGLTLGIILGMLLNQLILPGLPISFGDRPAIPPFLPLENWTAVIKLYLTLMIAFMTTLGIATGLLWRSNIHRALRIGQE
jgi:ABC-type antimicrobial peptide transport system permease subunit